MRHLKREVNREGLGAIGIGTLIVFIAMVLVAVIAAAVIIKTASELEQRAEEYGDDAVDQVGLSIHVQHFEGQIDVAGNEMVTLQTHVNLFGGSRALNLLSLIIHASGTDNEGTPVGFSADFLHDDALNPSGLPTFTVTEIIDPLDSYDEGSNEYILDSISTLRLDLDISTTLSDGLSPLSDITLKFMIAGGGAVTTESANTPGAYDSSAWYVLK